MTLSTFNNIDESITQICPWQHYGKTVSHALYYQYENPSIIMRLHGQGASSIILALIVLVIIINLSFPWSQFVIGNCTLRKFCPRIFHSRLACGPLPTSVCEKKEKKPHTLWVHPTLLTLISVLFLFIFCLLGCSKLMSFCVMGFECKRHEINVADEYLENLVFSDPHTPTRFVYPP